jgi:Divergent InlB B-repeat domain
VDQWLVGDAVAQIGGNGFVLSMVLSDKTVITTFKQASFTLNVIKSGNGEVNRSLDLLSYAMGTDVSLTAEPASGFRFMGWSGDAGGKDSPIMVTMDSAKTVVALFAAINPSDTDDDGILDAWEEDNFGGDPDVANETSDFDGDGVTDLDEFLLGTNPKRHNFRQPDAQIAVSTMKSLVSGGDVYDSEAGPAQLIDTKMARGTTKTFLVKVENDGNQTNSFLLTVPQSVPAGFTVKYFDGKINVTSQAASSSGYLINNLPPSGSKRIKVKVTVKAGARAGSAIEALLKAEHAEGPDVADAVRLKVMAK